MISKRLKKSIQVAGVLIPTLAFGFMSVPKLARADTQVEMTNALSDLKSAEANLQKGYHDKGGHRVKALKLVQQAETEVQQAIDFDSTHSGKMENKK